MKSPRCLLLIFLVLCALQHVAQAAGISTFSPQGEVARARQVRATFSEPVTGFGDPAAPAPFVVDCPGKGEGRWLDERRWVYDFERDLEPGLRCTFSLRPELKARSGAQFSGKTSFSFSTGGPVVVQTFPYAGDEVDEEQVFVLVQNGAATAASLLAHLYCEMEGVRERIPVKLIAGTVRDELLKRHAEDIDPQRISTVQCVQRFPSGAAMRLIWDKGIATTSGLATGQSQAYEYRVRPVFSASVKCERENANADCSPLLPLTLSFNSPVSRKLAQDVRIMGADGAKRKPWFGPGDNAPEVESIRFKPPFPAKSALTIELPRNLQDSAGRALANANQFPLKISMADYPPLAKFPAAPFGIVELDDHAALPVTLRNVEANLALRSVDGTAAPGMLSNLKIEGDAATIEWIGRLRQFHEKNVDVNGSSAESRSVGLLAREAAVKKLDLPVPQSGKDGSRPFEVVGIPFPAPGFYVLEIESQRLGTALLAKPAPMYVRTSALVTNLAVHVKLGRENSAVWVTALDSARPVAKADVRISDCNGKELWRGVTSADGVAMVPQALDSACSMDWERRPFEGLFVSARATDAKGRADMAFALTSWTEGIELFRFHVPTDTGRPATAAAHTVFDRTLLRTGETVSMKHFIRMQTRHGMGPLPERDLPDRLRIIHRGSAQEFRFPLAWHGQHAAHSEFVIPQQAKLGHYDVVLDSGPIEHSAANGGPADSTRQRYSSGSFRVEEFRLPLLQGRVTPPSRLLVMPNEIPFDVQLNYLNGGGAAGQAVNITSLLRTRSLKYPGYDGFSFQSGQDVEGNEQKIVADKLPVKLDGNGSGKTVVKGLPAIKAPKELLTEMTYADPNGEIQTVSHLTPLWPAAVVVGLRSGGWIAVRGQLSLTAVALDPAGRPQAGVPIEISGVAKQDNTYRKRLVGGFYAYENNSTSKPLGPLCSGKSDARGLLHCMVDLKESGNIDFTATARDKEGHTSEASESVWYSGNGDIWFGGENQDLIDILPEKKKYEPGEVAKFQVRMPFRNATALVAVEREGIIETRVMALNGRDPTISLPIRADYAPNVYVSVLAVRERLREVPWYSFFRWGWKQPVDWWSDFRENRAPGATIDLAKPAFKLGVAEIAVGARAHQLDVKVVADQSSYPIRSTAKITVQVKLPDGRPAAGAEFALAAVDEALLELQPNSSWDLLNAMLQRRSYGVETATAQMQVIGKRHYGRKAIPAGGGGGQSPTRSIVDTLLLWKPAVTLDANGRAQVEVPLNDSLTSFRIVAVANSGAGMFGSGSVTVRSTQDLQLISGLPPLVREGDQFNAMVTIRNTTARSMQVDVTARVAGMAPQPAPQTVMLVAGAVRELAWQAMAPAFSRDGVRQLVWEFAAQERGGAAVRDALRVTQRMASAVPVTVRQASLFQLEQSTSLDLTQPSGGIAGSGGIALTLAPSLVGGMAGVQRYFESYPYTCLEQKASRAIGLRDKALWSRVVAELPAYLDTDGLAYYYPPREGGGARGSDILTAYILAAAHESGFALPQQSRDRMLRGLSAFVEGKIMRDFWSPKKDLEVRKLAALEALSRYGNAQPRMLGSIQIAPNLWPTSAVLDWMALLQRMDGLADRSVRLAEADSIIRARLNYQGTRSGFSSEADDYWWWLMASGDANANRLILTVLDSPSWRADLPRLASGSIARQQRGHWSTTGANVWGSLAIEKFSRKFESAAVSGVTTAAVAQGSTQQTGWKAGAAETAAIRFAWPEQPAERLTLKHEGEGKPWVTLQSLAAVPLKAPVASGFQIRRTVVPLEQKQKGLLSRGDIVRIDLEVDAQGEMTNVVVSDPVPAGASVLGSGLGRDAVIGAGAQRPAGSAWLAYEERGFEAFRSYYEYVPKGKFSMSYRVRLNNAGVFNLPQTRVEAMYAPEMFGEIPNAVLTVK